DVVPDFFIFCPRWNEPPPNIYTPTFRAIINNGKHILTRCNIIPCRHFLEWRLNMKSFFNCYLIFHQFKSTIQIKSLNLPIKKLRLRLLTSSCGENKLHSLPSNTYEQCEVIIV